MARSWQDLGKASKELAMDLGNNTMASNTGHAIKFVSAAPQRPTRVRITEDQFTKLGQVGRGAYGAVYIAKDNNTNKIVALKVISRKEIFHTANQRFKLQDTLS